MTIGASLEFFLQLDATKVGFIGLPEMRTTLKAINPDLSDLDVLAIAESSGACFVDYRKLLKWLYGYVGDESCFATPSSLPRGRGSILKRGSTGSVRFSEISDAKAKESDNTKILAEQPSPSSTDAQKLKIKKNKSSQDLVSRKSRCLKRSASKKSQSQASLESGLDDFQKRLENSGIDTSAFGQGIAKPVEELYFEVAIDGASKLVTMADGSLKRIVSIVKADVVTQDMFGTWRHLLSNMQFMHDGRQRRRKDLLMMRIEEGQGWEEALHRAFTKKVGLNEALQKQKLSIHLPSLSYEEKETLSEGYPGLMTQYQIQRVTVFIKDNAQGLESIGLPEGRDFAVMEGVVGGNELGARLFLWSWGPTEAPIPIDSTHPLHEQAEQAPPNSKSEKVIGSPAAPPRRRMPVLDPLVKATVGFAQVPNADLAALLARSATNWEKARVAATRMRDPSYSLKEFHEDVTGAFPELKLYLFSEDGKLTTSGRTPDDEYQRTLGAMYAVYWLMRLDIDGKEGFSFGVDDDLRPLKPDKNNQKRFQFYENIDWGHFSELFMSAGLLVKDANSPGGMSACSKRCLAMLALTAIHDIMKVDALLPTVQDEHAPYHGYAQGSKISDHDIALGYVLENYPDLLPSYGGLEPSARTIVGFTQSKLEYNQGWLVQAEAPPGALFQTFKGLLQSGNVDSSYVSFYFAHWLTDLAGAEPYPLEGSEKFVLKFPHSVLQAFLRSFPIVEELSYKTESEVFEKYVSTRWEEHSPSLGPLPSSGLHAIAMLRLLCQAQGNANAILEAFKELPDEDRWLLSQEMAHTGCPGQKYSCIGDEDVEDNVPAILVYYGPALLQNAVKPGEAALALKRLCEVYRQTRLLWTDSLNRKGHITVRIDAIKDLCQQQIQDAMAAGQVFILREVNDIEGFVEMHSLQTLTDLCDEQVAKFRFLCLI